VASFFVENSRLSEKDREIFVFGLEIIISSIANVVTVLLLSLPFGQFCGTVLYLTILIISRQFTGGYHANSYRSCYLTFICIYLLTIPIVILVSVNIAQPLTIILACISIFPVFLFAPVQNKNRRLTKKEAVKFRKISRIFICLLVGLLTYYLFRYPQYYKMFLWGALALLTMAIFIVVEIIKNGGLINEKNRT
jgi:accessory gene regulator B